jgi:protocatechuate 3,4-dioxygenase beta subunit
MKNFRKYCSYQGVIFMPAYVSSTNKLTAISEDEKKANKKAVDFTLELDTHIILTGVVNDADSKPMPGAALRIYNVDINDPQNEVATELGLTFADANGKYQIALPALADDKHEYRVEVISALVA